MTTYHHETNQSDGPLLKHTPVIGFDMGGTSTDVSRFDGEFEHVFEATMAGISIQAPQVSIRDGSRLLK